MYCCILATHCQVWDVPSVGLAAVAQRTAVAKPSTSHTWLLKAALRAKPLSTRQAKPGRANAVTVASSDTVSRSYGQSQDDDVVIVSACRTPSCRARKGALREAHADDLMAAVLKATLRRTGVEPEAVGDICFGSVFPSSSKRANEARTAMFLAGFPPSVPCYTVNRQCAAGLQAIADVAAGIRVGYFDIGIAGGVETFTRDPLVWEGSDNPRVRESPDAQDVLLPLGITAEKVAERFGVCREEQDRLAAASHAKAAVAKAEGRFQNEIVSVDFLVKDACTGKEEHKVVSEDDTIRPDSTPDKLAQLKPCFQHGGSVTPGNSCQNTDCAAAVMLMKRSEAQRRGLPVMATLRSFAAVGVPPAVMGIGPAVAVPQALSRAGLSKDDVDVYEINEAFGSQAAYCVRELGLEPEKVNPNGGGIALGHPAGCTGVRQTVTLLHELSRRHESGKGGRYGVVSMCTGAGMGAAAVFESDASSSSADFSTSTLGSSSSDTNYG